MAERKKGFIYKMVVGKERDEDYARSTLPTNRWSLFWDVLKGRMFKMVLINLLMLIFIAPIAVLMYFWSSGVSALGVILPFTGNLGVGYPGTFDVGMNYIMQTNSLNNFFFLLLIPASFVAAIGLSGGFYIVRNLVWTEGVFVANDFWRGIRKNFWQFLFICALLSVVIYIAVINFSLLSIAQYTGDTSFWTVAAQIATYFMLAIVGMMCLYMMTLTVTYKLSIWQLLKNSFILTVALFFQNIFFIVLAAAPLAVGLLLMLFIPSNFISALLITVYVLVGLTIFVLAWTNFNQWAYDKFLNDKVDGAVKNRGIFPKEKDDAEEIKRRKKTEPARYSNPKKKRAVKPVTDKEVVLTDLYAGGFTRANIQKLQSEKEQLKIDAEKYASENKFDDENAEGYDDDKDFEGYEEAYLLDGYDPEDEEKGKGDEE